MGLVYYIQQFEFYFLQKKREEKVIYLGRGILANEVISAAKSLIIFSLLASKTGAATFAIRSLTAAGPI